jgi:cysteinyl-tRNA synthetase
MVQAYNKLKKQVMNLGNEDSVPTDNKYMDAFKDALADNLNTSLALTTLYDVLKSDLTNAEKRYLVKEFDKVLSLDLLKEEKQELDNDLVKYIEDKIEERKNAKKNKDFDLADKIRDELLSKGIILKDTREGTTYEVNNG